MKLDPRDRSLYRSYSNAADLVKFCVSVKETDLMVLAGSDLSGPVRDAVIEERYRLERHIAANPGFAASLVPLPDGPADPPIVRRMAAAARAAGVGPMAAVAGAVCDGVWASVADSAPDLIIENGGDVLVATTRERVVGIYTGEAGIDPGLGIRIGPGRSPVGVCTSSGRIGHSLSLGEAASATVVAPTAALADAAATAVGNAARGEDAVERALAAARAIAGVLGAVVVAGGRFGAWGEIELAGLQRGG